MLNTSPNAVALGLVAGDRLVQPALLDLARQVQRDGEIRESELEIAVPGRPPAWVHVRVAPLLDAHVLLLVEDRTTAHRVEEVRRDFVVNVSHELKTPVGGLSLLAEAIADAKDDPEAIDLFASRMQLESARLGKLIKEIVDLSRLQSADGMQRPTSVRVADVIREAVDLSSVESSAKEIRIRELVDPDLLAKTIRRLVPAVYVEGLGITDTTGAGQSAAPGAATGSSFRLSRYSVMSLAMAETRAAFSA